MAFSKLSAQEKDAFFGLLDEYFRSRPELFGSGGGQGQGGGASASTNALGLAAARAIVGGATAASSSNNSGNNVPPVNKFSPNNPYRSVLTGIGGRKNDEDGDNSSNNENANAAAQAAVTSVGRVAAATLAFNSGGGGGGAQNQSSASASPPTMPHRVPAGVAGNVPPASAAMGRALLGTPGVEVDKLVMKKTSVLDSFRKKPPAGTVVALPSAFPTPRNTFGPPPVRRTTSDSPNTNTTTNTTTTTTTTTSAGAGTRSVPPPHPPEEEEAEAETEYAEGEWAEVLYDYNSEDPGDLAIEAGSRVFVTTKSSEDWWSGQVEGQGKEGLFPASYVKLL